MENVLLETAFCGAAFFGIKLSDLATLVPARPAVNFYGEYAIAERGLTKLCQTSLCLRWGNRK